MKMLLRYKQKADYKFLRQLTAISCVVCLLVIAVGCERDIDQNFSVNEDLPIGLYLESRPNDFSLWIEALKETDLYNAFNVGGTYTAFVPDNDAMTAFMQEHGKSQVSDFDKEYLKEVVKYHTLNTKFMHTNFIEGYIPDTTFTGDKLITKYGDAGINSIYVNDEALIVEKDIEVINGVAHKIDKVLTVVTESLYEQIKKDETLTLFAEALEKTGWSDFLSEMDKNNLKFYTILGVSNDVFAANGVNSFQDLANKYSDIGNYKDAKDSLNMFVGYHILNGGLSYGDLSTFPTENKKRNVLTAVEGELATVSEENQEILFNDDEELNYKVELNTENMNNLAKNGVYHVIKQEMPVYTPKPTEIVWVLTEDNPEISGLPFYRDGLDNSSRSINEVDVERIKWKITPMTEGAGISYDQRFNMTKPGPNSPVTCEVNPSDFIRFYTAEKNGWIELRPPTIVKGKYKVYLGIINAPGRATFQTFVDGQKGPIYNHGWWAAGYQDKDLGTYTFGKTEEHVIKLSYIKGWIFQLHHIRFEPVE
ncbi:hypothetical protein EYV94_03485 [Puteibacter caeruleilacunae]|nr:hypothetical protein EYV94_03485 [Puteibacter caeruleilacunae]